MNTKLLRQKILDLAIRGKLTDQRKSDGTAADLLKDIAEAKPKKNGVILNGARSAKSKDPKQIIPLDKSEAPFEIPDNWEWVCVDSIASLITDGEHLTPRRVESFEGYYLLSARNIQDNAILLNDVDYVDEDEYNRIARRCNPRKNDVLISCSGSIGRIAIVKDDNKYVMVRSAAMIRPVLIHSYYLMYALQSNCLQNQIQNYSKQTAQANLFQAAIRALQIPLPPLAEQQLIAEKIEEAFAEIDAVEKNKELLKTHIKQTRQKILDLAIHGKLVPQDKNDEPAGVLLEKILQEKAQSDNKKSPKKKKTDNLATSDNRPYKKNGSVSAEDAPFDIPNSWVWAKLGDICVYGECDNIEVKNISDDAWILELEDIEKDSGRIINFITKKERQINGVRHSFKEGDVLYSKLRTYLNKVLVAPQDGFCSTEIMPIKADHLLNHYLNIVLRSQYFLEYTSLCGYGVKMPRLSTADAKKALIPLPPLAEQKRIASKIESLFSVLDAMGKECD